MGRLGVSGSAMSNCHLLSQLSRCSDPPTQKLETAFVMSLRFTSSWRRHINLGSCRIESLRIVTVHMKVKTLMFLCSIYTTIFSIRGISYSHQSGKQWILYCICVYSYNIVVRLRQILSIQVSVRRSHSRNRPSGS